MAPRFLIDAREFIHGRFTGIGKVLEGLTDALAASEMTQQIVLAAYDEGLIPDVLKHRDNIKVEEIPFSFLKSEKALSNLSKLGFSLLISPYPKLSLFGSRCAALNVVHDVLDLTHPAYRRRPKAYLDRFRLKRALRRADLTWYVSSWSLEETRSLVGYVGKNPKVRHNGIAEIFHPQKEKNEGDILKNYKLQPGYILVVGNGLPHKNLGVLLGISSRLGRDVVFVGVSKPHQEYWWRLYPGSRALWIVQVPGKDLAVIMRNAFCLAQPSTAEGYGYPPLEAMACGKPAVVSNIAVLRETTGGHALFADPENPRDWRQAFEALEDTALYENQIQEGRKWVEPLRGRRGWKRHLLDIEQLLKHAETRL